MTDPLRNESRATIVGQNFYDLGRVNTNPFGKFRKNFRNFQKDPKKKRKLFNPFARGMVKNWTIQ